MAINKQLEYGDEASFITTFLAPLLRRVGFSIVAEYHSSQEFGKDLVFGEIDRFGHVCYHGLQAKYKGSISQSDSNGLIEDCKEAFNNPFRHPNTGADEHINTFVVANAGSIAPNARTNFFNALNTPHGGRIRLLDGKSLLALDKWAAVNQVQFVGEYLSGLLFEVRYNNRLLASIRHLVKEYLQDQKRPLPLERLRIAATVNYLTRPFASSHIDIDVVNQYCHRIANNLNPGLDHVAGAASLENRRAIAQDILVWADEIGRLAQGLEEAINIVLIQLGPLAGV